MNRPLVSVCILSYNRKDDLVRTLKVLQADPYGALELIVADNASGDGTQELLKRAFPGVQLLEQPQNIGIDALSAAFMAATGAYILVLDDDSWPEVETIGRAVERFEAAPGLGLVACDIIDPNSKLRWDMAYLPQEAGDAPQAWHCFAGCGFFMRTGLLQEIGGYPEDFFLYANEAPLAIEVLRRGFELEFLPSARVFHAMPQRQGKFSRNHIFYGLRNDLQTAWRYYTGWRYYDVLFGRLATGLLLFSSLGRGMFREYAQVLRELSAYRRSHERRPVSRTVMQRSAQAFDGTTLSTLISRRNLRRLLWYNGFYKDGRVVS